MRSAGAIVGPRRSCARIARRRRRSATVLRKQRRPACASRIGTDSGVYPHGDNARQFAYMVRYGLSPMDAIRSATLNSCAVAGPETRSRLDRRRQVRRPDRGRRRSAAERRALRQVKAVIKGVMQVARRQMIVETGDCMNSQRMSDESRITSHPSRAAPPARQLGFWMCLALVVGNIIGSGVFLLPASLAPYGVNSIFGWMVTAAGRDAARLCVRTAGARVSAGRRTICLSARRLRRADRVSDGVGLLDVGLGRQRRHCNRYGR